jgi:hypothetical protein
MKRLLFSLMLLASSTRGLSQANIYHPFPLDGGEWRSDYFDAYCGGLCEQRRYYTIGDTIIDSLYYKKLYGDRVYSAGPDFYGIYFGALREDTANRKIYFYGVDNPFEYLLFDFDLDSGQLAPQTFLHYNEDSMWVTSIDSVLIGNDYHKRFNLSCPGFPVSLIEGMGWSGGLILEPYFNGLGFEVIYNLKCLKVNGIIQYLDTSYAYPACDLPTEVNEVNSRNKYSIAFPNPCYLGDPIFFKMTEELPITIVFQDLSGKIISSKTLNNDYLISVSSVHFSKGIYFFKVFKSNSLIHFGKVIIQ